MQLWKRACLLAYISVHLALAIDVQGDTVVFPCSKDRGICDFVNAVNRTTGRTVWTYGLQSTFGIYGCKMLGWNKETLMCSSFDEGYNSRPAVHGVRLSDGKRQWLVQVPNSTASAMAEVAGIDTMLEQIYFNVWVEETSAVKRCLLALSTKGETLWTECIVVPGPLPTWYVPPGPLPSGEICADEVCKSKRRVLLLTGIGKLHAFDSRKGTKLWDFSARCLHHRKFSTDGTCVPTIAPDGKTVLVSTNCFMTSSRAKCKSAHIALDAFSGKQNWIKNITGDVSAFSKDGKLAYMYSVSVTYQGYLTTYSATSTLTGETVWGMSGRADGLMALAPSIDGQTLFAWNYGRRHSDSVLWSVDPTTGKNRTLGHAPINNCGGHVSLDAHGEALYMSSRDCAPTGGSALSTKDASLLWSSDCETASSSSPKNLIV